MHPFARRDELVIQEFAEEVLIYDLRIDRAFCLNQTLALVWQNCDGKKSVSEISSKIGKVLGARVSEDVVWLALNQLEKANLLANQEKISNKFYNLSRREMIKRIGAASAVALPIIASIVAPPAIHAASGLAPGDSCTSHFQCASGICLNPGCNASGNSRRCREPGDCP